VTPRSRSTVSAGKRLTRSFCQSLLRSLSAEANATPLSIENTRALSPALEIRKFPTFESPCSIRK
jgi:hypothetical protein